MRLALFVAAALVLCVHGDDVAAESQSSSVADVQSHDAADHDAVHEALSGTPVEYLTLNVAVSDTGIEPSVLFVPAGRPVQLLVRNRGTVEHHYHAVGMVTDDLTWVTRGVAAIGAGPGTDHDHHNRAFVRTRAASPAGITPAGNEVHAYVTAAQGLDVVLFTATQTGTFVVKWDPLESTCRHASLSIL